MTRTKRKIFFRYVPPVLSVVVSIGGALVMVGWFFEISALTQLVPGFVTMKFSTAFNFFLSGIIVLAIHFYLKHQVTFALTILPVCSFIVFLLMATLLSSVILGVNSGIELLVVQEHSAAVATIKPGQPSVGTMLAFIFLATAGLIALFDVGWRLIGLRALGLGVFVLGGVALVGYMLAVPSLYYHVDGLSSAMAVHTALFFVLLGLGLILIKMES